MLYQVGVLVWSWEELKNAVEKIDATDILKWWMNEERQAAINIFRNKYAKSSISARQEWFDFVLKKA